MSESVNKYDSEYRDYVFSTLADIDNIYNEIITGLTLTGVSTSTRFYFKNNSRINKQADKLIKEATEKVISRISLGIATAWNISNTKNDNVVRKMFGNRTIPQRFTARNTEGLNAFLKQKTNGFTVSERVWKYNKSLKDNLEKAIDIALSEGKSAQELSRSIKQYLNNPDALFRKVKDKYGNLKLSQNALSYHPGQGVYRSAHQNAMRLARNTINRAYRLADWERWQTLPFVVGYEIKISTRKSTVCSLCKQLQGVYPKNFKFISWHVSCMCSCIPILIDSNNLNKVLDGQIPKQPDLPNNFKKWYNEQDIKEGKFPEWYNDNKTLLTKL